MGDSLQEKLEWELLKKGLGQVVDRAAASISEAADSSLDSLERRLLGKAGENPESGDALERVRQHYGVTTKPSEGPTTEDPLLKVRAQLEALKKERGTSTIPVETPAPEPPKPAPLNDPLAQARAQLEEMKKARNSPPPGPVKRTL
jgi:hypothetical protein